MPLNRDDIIGEAAISGSSGVTCTKAEIHIDPITRNLRIDFHVADITVLDDGRNFVTPRMPISIDLTDGTATKTIKIYNRRTGNPVSGVTRTYDLLSRDIMSAFFHAYASAPQQP